MPASQQREQRDQSCPKGTGKSGGRYFFDPFELKMKFAMIGPDQNGSMVDGSDAQLGKYFDLK